jgi:hypothetical protein
MRAALCAVPDLGVIELRGRCAGNNCPIFSFKEEVAA